MKCDMPKKGIVARHIKENLHMFQGAIFVETGIMHSENSHASQPSVFAFGTFPAQFTPSIKRFLGLLLEYRHFHHRCISFSDREIISILSEISKKN